MKDSYNRSINYLRISVTDFCNLKCKYCMPEAGIKKIKHEEILTFEEIEFISKILINFGINKIRLTGGEPLIRKNIISLITKIKNLNGIKDLSLTTNGILLEKYALELKNAGVNRINISLDTLKDDKYQYITRGGNIKDVFNGIAAAKKLGFYPIKINVVLIKGFNDDEICDLVNLTKDDDIDVRFIELMPFGKSAFFSENHFISNKIVLEKVKDLKLIDNQDISSSAVYYKSEGYKGRVGLINPVSHKFCNTCNRIRLTANGRLRMCLHSDSYIDLKTPLRQGKDIIPIILEGVKTKPKENTFYETSSVKSNMSQIGG
ncbi:MAG: GTP 3',8-cyclase MoaA [Desulfobacterales bacterium]|nr:GTP 3',8-cyclase MoaA [Desulfobacterales bacterium]